MYHNKYKVSDKVWLSVVTNGNPFEIEIIEATVEEVVLRTDTGGYFYRLRLPGGLLAVENESYCHDKEWDARNELAFQLLKMEPGLHVAEDQIETIKALIDSVENPKEATDGTD